MSSTRNIADGFSITGLLAESSRTRERYPVVEIDVSTIADHPANVAYSMGREAIRKLAASIAESGLTDIPLVRKMADGSWQMISGHRRKAAFALLAESDPAYAKMPCRIIEKISDEEAITLLHTANYFVRALTVSERAAATSALGLEVKRLRETDDSYRGRRTEDIKAEIIESQTGRKVSGKTIQREERMAQKIEASLSPKWAREANAGNLSLEAVDTLAEMPQAKQAELYDAKSRGCVSKRQLSEYVKECTSAKRNADARLSKAANLITSYLENPPRNVSSLDLSELEKIAALTARFGGKGKRYAPDAHGALGAKSSK